MALRTWSGHWTFLHEAGFSLGIASRKPFCDDDSTSSSSFSNYELDNKKHQWVESARRTNDSGERE